GDVGRTTPTTGIAGCCARAASGHAAAAPPMSVMNWRRLMSLNRGRALGLPHPQTSTERSAGPWAELDCSASGISRELICLIILWEIRNFGVVDQLEAAFTAGLAGRGPWGCSAANRNVATKTRILKRGKEKAAFERRNDVYARMRVIASRLTPSEMERLATYYRAGFRKDGVMTRCPRPKGRFWQNRRRVKNRP